MKQGIVILLLLALAAPAFGQDKLDPIPNVSNAATQAVKNQMGELLTANLQLQEQVKELQRDLTIWHQRALDCRKANPLPSVNANGSIAPKPFK